MNDESILLAQIEAMLRVYKWKRRKDTGALLGRGIKNTGDAIIIGNDELNYAPYTNEAWVSPRWNGKINPNQGWIDTNVIQAVRLFAAQYGYDIEVKRG
jgi:cell wall-associated NlpC family hydrolase